MSESRILLTEASIFDTATGAIVPDQAIVIDDGRIDWVGPTASAPSIDGEVRALGGATVLPGLMNCHVHLMGDGHDAHRSGDAFGEGLVWASVQATVNARATLESGVTSVRDCGSLEGMAIDFARIVETGFIVGPRIQAAGRVITMTGGHGHAIGRQADGPWKIAEATRAELHEGADFIKIMATGGVLTKGVSPLQTALSVEELRAAADEAHHAGKRITSHAIGGQGVKNAIIAGIDSIEHACFMDEEAIQLALDHGTIIVPTLLAVDRIAQNGDTLPAWMHEKVMLEAEASETSFRAAAAAGVRIAGGTDAGTPDNPHGDMPDELALMVRFGMTPAQAIIASTVVSAQNFGLDDQLGAVAAGRLADLLVVGGDPTADIAALRDVRLVLSRGRIVHEPALQGA